jgi:hypothetical protein
VYLQYLYNFYSSICEDWCTSSLAHFFMFRHNGTSQVTGVLQFCIAKTAQV